MPEEKDVWNGTPSQIVNLKAFLIMGAFFWLAVPVFVIVWKWLVIKNTRYELTTERLIFRKGVLNKTVDELELYRIRDYRLKKPLYLRIFSLGNIILTTSDRSHPEFVLIAIRDSDKLREDLRRFVEVCRARRGVREIDFE